MAYHREAVMISRDPGAWALAEEHLARVERGEKILDYNLFRCTCHPKTVICQHTIEAVDWNEDGPEPKQYEGFVCRHCGEWCSNECGSPIARSCNECAA